jgi:undecaprenyl diphosphate synthase
MERTSSNDRINLILALNYSSRSEIIGAVKRISSDYERGNIHLNQINEELISSYLYTAEIPDPELIIRTSGEHRLSNFLLWQSSYAEFYFAQVFWPDFDKSHLEDAIFDYQNRERRFGMVSEQVK